MFDDKSWNRDVVDITKKNQCIDSQLFPRVAAHSLQIIFVVKR